MITVCRQTVALGRIHAGRTVTVHVSEHTLAIELDDETRTVRRTTTRPVVVRQGQPAAQRRARARRNGLSPQARTRKQSNPHRPRRMKLQDPYET